MNKRHLLVLLAIAVIAALAVVFYPREAAQPEVTAPAPAATPRATPVPAAPPSAAASLVGRITDGEGNPLGGAAVRVAPRRDRDASAVRAVRAGVDGRYELGDLDPGRYVVTAAAEGYLPGVHEELVLRAGDKGEVNLKLEKGGVVVRGMVSDRTGGAVAGALVEAAPIPGIMGAARERAAAAFSDAAGRYVLHVAGGRYRMSAGHPDYVGDARSVDVGAGGASVDFALMPGGVIEGIVRELGSGAPVPGAEVAHAREALAGLPFSDALPLGGRGGSVTANGDGTFRITGLDPGGIRLEARGAGRASREPTVVSLGVAETVSGVEVFVGAAHDVRGVVKYEDGSAVAGAEVEAFGKAGRARAVAGDDGSFALRGLGPGPWNLAATGPDALPGRRPTRVNVKDADVADVTLTLRRGVAVSGRVEPPTEALVRHKRDLAPPSPGMGGMVMMAGASTSARADGSFALRGLEPATITLEAVAADGRRGEAEVAVGEAGARDVVIRLETKGAIAGRVVDESRKPVAGAVVTVSRIEDPNARTQVIMNGVELGAARGAVDGEGRFDIAGLEAGDYELSVTDDGSDALAFAKGAARPKVTLKANERREGVELVVEAKDGTISGTVLAPDGKPLPDAWVALSPGFPEPLAGRPSEGSPRQVSRMVFVDSNEASSGGAPPVLTDAAGRFSFGDLRRGKYQLFGEGQKGAARGLLAGVETGSDATLKLAWLTKIEGRVTAGGKAVGELTVKLEGTRQRTQTFRDAGGAFAMTRVDPGKYTVRVSAPEGSAVVETTVAAEGGGEPLQIALVSNGKVVGKAVKKDGTPLAGAHVVLAPVEKDGRLRIEIDGSGPTTAADGSFAVDAGPGRHNLVVLAVGGPPLRKEVEVAVGQVVDVGTLQAQ